MALYMMQIKYTREAIKGHCRKVAATRRTTPLGR